MLGGYSHFGRAVRHCITPPRTPMVPRTPRIAWIPARHRKPFPHLTDTEKTTPGEFTCEKRKTKCLVRSRKKTRASVRWLWYACGDVQECVAYQTLGTPSKHGSQTTYSILRAKSESYLHHIRVPDARRTQGFPRFASEEVGEFAFFLRPRPGVVPGARLEVRRVAKRADPPQAGGEGYLGLWGVGVGGGLGWSATGTPALGSIGNDKRRGDSISMA